MLSGWEKETLAWLEDEPSAPLPAPPPEVVEPTGTSPHLTLWVPVQKKVLEGGRCVRCLFQRGPFSRGCAGGCLWSGLCSICPTVSVLLCPTCTQRRW